MNTTLDAQALRSTAASQWSTIHRYYRDDNTTLNLLADFISHPTSPATPLKAELISAALHH